MSTRRSFLKMLGLASSSVAFGSSAIPQLQGGFKAEDVVAIGTDSTPIQARRVVREPSLPHFRMRFHPSIHERLGIPEDGLVLIPAHKSAMNSEYVPSVAGIAIMYRACYIEEYDHFSAKVKKSKDGNDSLSNAPLYVVTPEAFGKHLAPEWITKSSKMGWMEGGFEQRYMDTIKNTIYG